jgi:hypothetical protein
MLNVAAKIKKLNQRHCLKEVKFIFSADIRKEAIKRFRALEAK